MIKPAEEAKPGGKTTTLNAVSAPKADQIQRLTKCECEKKSGCGAEAHRSCTGTDGTLPTEESLSR